MRGARCERCSLSIEVFAMSENFENEFSVNERAALHNLKREEPPPAFLEEMVVARLKKSQLLYTVPPFLSRRTPRIVGAIALALLVFATGALVGANLPAGRKPTSAQFVLLLKAGNASDRPRSREEVMRIVAEYSDWARQLREKGVPIDGEKLKQDVRELGDTSAPALSGGADHKRISGYFVIGAPNFDQAVHIASGCPHLKYGGTIEVRQIENF
jgi:hypothetical protein